MGLWVSTVSFEFLNILLGAVVNLCKQFSGELFLIWLNVCMWDRVPEHEQRERPPSLAAVQPAGIPALGRAFSLLLTETNMGVLRHFRSKTNIKLEICGICLHEVLSLTVQLAK